MSDDKIITPITNITIEPTKNGDFRIAIRPQDSNTTFAGGVTDGTPSNTANVEKEILTKLNDIIKTATEKEYLENGRNGISGELRIKKIIDGRTLDVINKIEGYKTAKARGDKDLPSSMSIPLAFVEIERHNNDKITISVRQSNSSEHIGMVTIDKDTDDKTIKEVVTKLSNSAIVKTLTDSSFPITDVVKDAKKLQTKLAQTPATTIAGGGAGTIEVGIAAAQHEGKSI